MIKVSKTIFLATAAAITVATASHGADLPDKAIAPDLAPVVQASDYDWSGAYVGLNAGIGFEGSFDNNFGANLDSGAAFIGGGVIGYNHQIDKFVVGIEGDLNYTGVDANSGAVETDLDLLGTVTARVGYTPVDRVLTYLEGGYAFGLLDAQNGAASDDSFNNGFVVGGGAEYAITDNVLTGIEYNYVDLQDRNLSLGAGNTDAGFDGHFVKFNLKYKF